MLRAEEAADKRFAESETYTNYSSEESDESDYESKEVGWSYSKIVIFRLNLILISTLKSSALLI